MRHLQLLLVRAGVGHMQTFILAQQHGRRDRCWNTRSWHVGHILGCTRIGLFWCSEEGHEGPGVVADVLEVSTKQQTVHWDLQHRARLHIAMRQAHVQMSLPDQKSILLTNVEAPSHP